MKKSISLFFAAIILSSAGLAQAQNSASTTAQEAATISQPILIYKNTDLNFGGIVAGLVSGTAHVTGTIGTLTVPVSGSPTGVTTTAIAFSPSNGPIAYTGTGTSSYSNPTKVTAQVASFIVTGEPCLTYSIAVSGGTTVTDQSIPGHSMSVALDHPAGGNVNVAGTAGQISNNGDPGTDKFTVGGILTVGAFQTSGYYTGSFTVVVTYN
jgi:hypothetical protein